MTDILINSCYALACMAAFIGSIQVYCKMNLMDEKTVIRTIQITVGVVIALIAIAQILG